MKAKRKNVHSSNKSKIRFLSIIFILLITAILVGTDYYSKKKQDISVVTINNISLPVKQFKSELQRNVPDLYTYFRTEHNIVADDEENFWKDSFGGENPAEIDRQKVLQQWTENIIILELAKEKGMIKDITFKGLVKQWKNENILRKQKMKNGEIVYGPYEYSWEGFIDTLISTFQSNLVTMFSENEFKLSNVELKKIYEAEKEEKYLYDDDITIDQIRISYYDKDPNLSNELLKTAEENIKKAKARIDSGESFETVASYFNRDGSLMEKRYKPENSYEDDKTDNTVRRNALQLKQGEVSGIIQDEIGQFFAIIRCTDRKPGGYIPFDEIKVNIQLTYAKDKFDQMILQKTKDAEIIVNNKVYSKMLP